jgi:hypothetical protein
VDYVPFKAKVYGFNKEAGIPLIEVKNGSKYGLRNSCYEVSRDDIVRFCDDNSELLTLSVDNSDSTVLYSTPKKGTLIRSFGTFQEGEPVIGISARMADSKKNLKEDFKLGQDLNTRTQHFKMSLEDDDRNSLNGALVAPFYGLTAFMYGRGEAAVGDSLTIYGEEDVETSSSKGQKNYIVKIFNKDGSSKGFQSEHYFDIPVNQVILSE